MPRLALARGLGLKRVFEWSGTLNWRWWQGYVEASRAFSLSYDPGSTRVKRALLKWNAQNSLWTRFFISIDDRIVVRSGWGWRGGLIKGEVDITDLMAPGRHEVKVWAERTYATVPETVTFQVVVEVEYEGVPPEGKPEAPPPEKAWSVVKWALVLTGLAAGAAAAAKVVSTIRGRRGHTSGGAVRWSGWLS